MMQENLCPWFAQFAVYVLALELEKKELERHRHRKELWEALQWRALSQDELKEVAQWGNDLNIGREPFNREQKARELDTAKRMQVAFQLAKANAHH